MPSLHEPRLSVSVRTTTRETQAITRTQAHFFRCSAQLAARCAAYVLHAGTLGEHHFPALAQCARGRLPALARWSGRPCAAAEGQRVRTRSSSSICPEVNSSGAAVRCTTNRAPSVQPRTASPSGRSSGSGAPSFPPVKRRRRMCVGSGASWEAHAASVAAV